METIKLAQNMQRISNVKAIQTSENFVLKIRLKYVEFSRVSFEVKTGYGVLLSWPNSLIDMLFCSSIFT